MNVYTPCKGDKVVLDITTYQGNKRGVGEIIKVDLDRVTVRFKDYHPEHGWELRFTERRFNAVTVCYPGATEGEENVGKRQED